MKPSPRLAARAVAPALAALALAAPAAVARPADTGGPGSRSDAPARVDLRSADAIDAAAGRGAPASTVDASAIAARTAMATPRVQSTGAGFDWGSAAIGAAAAAGLALLAAGAFGIARRGRVRMAR